MKEGGNQLIYHSSPLLMGAPRVREADAQKAREADTETETERHLRTQKTHQEWQGTAKQ